MRKLKGWVELVSSTPLERSDEVCKFIKRLPTENDNLELASLEANENEIVAIELVQWDDDPPSLSALLRPLVELLETGEYLFFEEKVAVSSKPRTLKATLVTGVGIFKGEQDALHMLLASRDMTLETIEKAEGEADEELDEESEE